MNDFDFEELDKAVNQLAGKAPEGQPSDDHESSADRAESALSPAMSRAAAARAQSESLNKQTQIVTRPAPHVPPSDKPVIPIKHTSRLGDVRSKPRGAYMDIVAPPARKPVARVGVSISPISSPKEVIPEAPAKTGEDTANHPQPESHEVPEPLAAPKDLAERAQPRPTEPTAEPKAAAGVAWPDPLDFGGQAGADKAKAHDQAEEPDQPEPAPSELEPAEPSSPFIPEAKVEKRPLGAFSNFKLEKPEEPEAKDELTPKPDGTFEEPDQPKPEPPDQPPAPVKDEPGKPDMLETAMMSIPKQYMSEEKTPDKAVRPVYDTKEYHPPLLEATVHGRKGSMWGKLFIALVVLAILSVAAYLTYLYIVQR